VNIPVKNNYFFASKLFLCDPCGYSSIVEKTEATSSSSMSMMSWWSDDSECTVNFPRANRSGRLNGATSSYEGSLTCVSALVGIS